MNIEESTFKVIAVAIASCVNKKDEFETARYNEVVEFAAKPSDFANGYTAENWNAVILWNFLAAVINQNFGNTAIPTSAEGIEKIGDKVRRHYAVRYKIINLGKFINKAIEDIKAYARDLNLYKYIDELNYVKNDPKKIAPGCEVTQAFDKDKNARFKITRAKVRDCDDTVSGSVEVYIENSEVDGFALSNGAFVSLGYNMEVEPVNVYNLSVADTKRIKVKKSFKNKYLSEEYFNATLLPMAKLHGITNKRGNCWVIAAMQTINASPTLRKAIETLSEREKIPVAKALWGMLHKMQNDTVAGDEVLDFTKRLSNALANVYETEADPAEYAIDTEMSTQVIGKLNEGTFGDDSNSPDLLEMIFTALMREVDERGITNNPLPELKMEKYRLRKDTGKPMCECDESTGKEVVRSVQGGVRIQFLYAARL